MKIVPMSVELVDRMGSDLSVVNAARVSFSKLSEYETFTEPSLISTFVDGTPIPRVRRRLKESDVKLISYLAKHNHFSPFCHAFLSFRIKVPIFIARQLGKHQVGLSWNEVSRRYVSDEPEFWFPKTYRKAAENVKQGSSDEAIDILIYHGTQGKNGIDDPALDTCAIALETYQHLLDKGVCAEQARMFLPQNMMTEFIWSGSLQAFARIYSLRIEGHAQKEVQDFAKMLGELIPGDFKHSWEALTNG